ncbi:MerR family transcriptional regulator [Actinophytocola xinjiangensis]|uniref:MerR family transcriptional regulator n=1 Tax=Actinophytocola xinjiangensis TaxID=485602 RepID=UPI000AE8AB9F
MGDHRDPVSGGVSLLRPAVAGDPAEPTLSVAAVARRLGVAPATLRTWDRRYGIGPRGHTTGRHRRYAPADVARLELMQQALLRGVTPAEAAGYALSSRRPAEGVRIIAQRDRPPDILDRSASVVGINRAATAMDAVVTQQLVEAAVRDLGVLACWDGVLAPVLGALGGHGGCVEVARMVEECVLAAMIGATPLVTVARNPHPVLLCGVPGERRALPVYVLRAALAQAGIGTQLLGPDLPPAALAAAVRRTGPAAVAVWSARARRGGAEVFGGVPRTRQRVRLFACGPGWLADDLPGRVERLDGLAGAVRRIEALVGAPR